MTPETLFETRLYLSARHPLTAENSVDCLKATIKRFRPAAIRLHLDETEQLTRQVNDIRATCVACDVAIILTDCPALVALLDCDGVHITDATLDIASIRDSIPAQTQLGVFCDTSRDAALRAGEAGADYIAINAEADDLARWWLEIMELPLVAEDVRTSERAQTLTADGVDFLHVSIDFIKSVEDVSATLVALGFAA